MLPVAFPFAETKILFVVSDEGAIRVEWLHDEVCLLALDPTTLGIEGSVLLLDVAKC